MANEQTIAVKITTDAAGANETVKGYKAQLREATAELVNMSMKFGETSKEAANAAKKVAGLKDSIGDAKALADTFNPDKKFVALGGALQGAVGGFSALQGAMGLFGGESKQVEQAMLKVQSAMALQQGISGVFGAIDSFKLLYAQIIKSSGAQKIYALATTLATTVQKMFGVAVVTTSNSFKVLRGAIISTGIGALVVAVGFLVDKIISWANSASAAEKAQTKLAAATDKTNAAIGNQIRILQAQGGQEAIIYNLKQKQTENDLVTLRAKFKLQNGLNAEDMKQFEDLKTNKKVLEIEEQNRLKKIADDKAAAEEKAHQKEVKTGEQSVKVNKKNNDAKQKDNEDAAQKLKEFEDAKLNETNATSDLIQEQRIAAVKNEYDRKLLIIDTALDKETEKNIAAKDKGLISQIDFDLREKINKEQSQAEKDIAKDERDKAELEKQKKVAAESTKIDFDKSEANKDIAEKENQHRQLMFDAIANGLNSVADIIGRDTAAGKALAVSASLINTYAAITGQLKAFAGVPIPGYAIAQAIATGVAGFGAVRNILKVNVPKGGGGGGGNMSLPNISASAPLQAQAATTTLDQRSINSIGQASSRAFVLETDVTNNQERIARLNRAARINTILILLSCYFMHI